jgi:hypothetical protein
MSNHKLKIQLFNTDPRCYWCKRTTKLICSAALEGDADPLMATIDHMVSRYHLHRWVKRKRGQPRKVLACYECNHGRSTLETLCLSRAEILSRSKGFSLSPRGKPKIIVPLPTVREVKKVLKA